MGLTKTVVPDAPSVLLMRTCVLSYEKGNEYMQIFSTGHNAIFSRVLRDSIGHYVGRLVGRSVPNQFAFFVFFLGFERSEPSKAIKS